MGKTAVLVVVAAAVTATALLGWAATRGDAAPAPAGVWQKVTRRKMGAVVKATGVIKAQSGAEVRVSAQTGGLIGRVLVDVGDEVKRGQLLCDVDARAQRAQQQQAIAATRSAEVGLRYALADLRRKRELATAGVLPPSEIELLERNAALAEAALAEARANLQLAAVRLADAEIRAPISGVVADVAAWPGEAVISGPVPSPLLTLLDAGRLEAWAYVDETDIGQVRVGQAARFTVESEPRQTITGSVTQIRPLPEIRDNVVNYVVVITFVPPAHPVVRPEMTANIKIELTADTPVLVVPRRAVASELGDSYVLVPSLHGIERRTVTLGNRDENSWEIVSGLSEEDRVLLKTGL